jgi:hypothetical protein
MNSLEYNNFITPAVLPSSHISRGNTPRCIMHIHLSPSFLADVVIVRQSHSEHCCLFGVVCAVVIVVGEQKQRLTAINSEQQGPRFATAV